MKTILLLFTAFSMFVLQTQAQTAIPKAQSMFVYNFSRLVEWPEADRSGNFVIGVVGGSDVYSELEVYCRGKKVGLQDIVVKRFNEPDQLEKVHILFVSFNRSNRIDDVISRVGSNSTLIIGERRGLIDSGAAINFLVEGDRLRFEIKTSNASKYGLKVNSRLEEMGIVVN